MIETIDIELNGFAYQVEVDVTESYDYYDDGEDSSVCEQTTYDVEIYEVYLVKGRNVYRVINERILEEINNEDLLNYYFDQCL